jgi:hypothetical protein
MEVVSCRDKVGGEREGFEKEIGVFGGGYGLASCGKLEAALVIGMVGARSSVRDWGVQLRGSVI